MHQKYILKRYEIPYRTGDPFRQQVINYIDRCHLEDGGYFFARIPPSSGTDTYYAVKSLALLGVKPPKPKATAAFFLEQIKDGTLSSITGIFTAVEVLNELGLITDELKKYAQNKILALQNKAGGFGAQDNIYIEVSSELEETYRAVKLLQTLSAAFDEQAVTDVLCSLKNADGGYGRDVRSTLASTFYATAIHKLLGADTQKLACTAAYLRRRENNWGVQYIEDLYWLAEGLANLGEKPLSPRRITQFVLECQRQNGGFARVPIMSIPTLEYTFYALSILKQVSAL